MSSREPKARRFQAPRWSEPLIMEMGTPGERGILLPRTEQEVKDRVGDVVSRIPASMKRDAPPKLPKLSQPQILRHYMRLSQMCLGADVAIDISQGTCTMKYSPKVNEMLARMPQMTELHPLQHEDTLQGILEIASRFEQILKEISGMDHFTFHPGSGAQGIYTNACLIRAYHYFRGESHRDEIITTAFSHPADAATPNTAGFRVITLMPGENGCPSLDAVKAAVSDRTAGMMITNPEDTGIFNPQIRDMTDIVHKAGGLCSYDQANANAIMGITRAKEAGFDMCHFNLHKTFGSPHGCAGPGSGAVGVIKELARFLPVPVIEFDGERYRLEYDREETIGKIRGFMGNLQVVLRAYAWAMSMGAEGLKTVSETAVLNNNYFTKKVLEIPGIDMPYRDQPRIEQTRFTWAPIVNDTGVSTMDMTRRAVDFGVPDLWTSHHPWIIPEPFTLEPTETYSVEDMDEYIAMLRQMSEEAYSDPELVKSSPHNSTIKRIDETAIDDPQRWAMTWRAYLKKQAAGGRD